MLGQKCSTWNTISGLCAHECGHRHSIHTQLDSTLGLVGARGSAQNRMGLMSLSIPNPVGGGAARGPDAVTIPDTKHIVNVRRAFGSDNNEYHRLIGHFLFQRTLSAVSKTTRDWHHSPGQMAKQRSLASGVIWMTRFDPAAETTYLVRYFCSIW